MELLYKLLRQDSMSREGVVITTSALSIIVNFIVASVKIVVGIAVSSIAIISEGINNATDSITSLITIIGAKLSTKHPTERHPFGFGRIEYLTSLVIAIFIFLAGFELLKKSVEIMFNPTELSISYMTLCIIGVSAVVKYLLGTFTVKEGKRVDSGSLIALGKDCINDCVVSAVTILSALVFLIFGKNIDAYAGAFTSLFIFKAGIDIIKETLSDLLGRAGNKELADQIYKIVRAEPIVFNAADMMLHNYGPDSYSGSVNIEIDHDKTVGEVYAAIHKLQLKIMHEYNIVMVFGVYAVDQDHEVIREMRSYIGSFVKGNKHIKSYHALYVDPDNNDIYCDFIVDYDLRDWEALREEFLVYMGKKYCGQKVNLVIETKFV